MLSLVLGLIQALTACQRAPSHYQQESYVFGTRVQITIVGVEDAKAQQATAAVLSNLDRLHHKYHAWQGSSTLSQINRAFAQKQPFPIDAETQSILTKASVYSQKSQSLFNPAMGGLIGLWGFHADTFGDNIPPADAIKAWQTQAPSMGDLHITQGLVRSKNPAVQLDLGGIAKGWALDQSAAILRQHGIDNALINIGGNIMALGKNHDKPWRIALQHPRKNTPLAEINLNDGEAIGTSGDYQRYFMHEGQRYCHIIDPRTGWPSMGTQSVSLITHTGPDAGIQSDALSKPFFIATPADAKKLAKTFHLDYILMIDAQGTAYLSAPMQARIRWITPPARILAL